MSFVIVDGNSLIHRAFYALPAMHAPSGAPTNAVYGFFSMLFHVLDTYKPDHLCVAFDRKEKTFRHEAYADYKAGRQKTADELIQQFGILREALESVGISTADLIGYEADDLLGTLSAAAEKEGMDVFLLSGDKDIFQLASDRVKILLTRKGVSDLEVFDVPHLREVYDLSPAQMIDLKSLMGDASDNIPGVPGVGEKTGLKLLYQYGTLDGVYDHLDEMPKNKLREKLENNRDLAYFSKDLATIRRDAPLGRPLGDFAFEGLDPEKLTQTFGILGFHSLLKRRGIEPKQPEARSQKIENKAALQALAAQWKQEPCLAFLLEESGLAFARDEKEEYRLDFADLPWEEAKEVLADLLTDPNIQKTVHDGKSLLHKLDGQLQMDFDVMIAAYCLDPTARNFSLEKLCQRYELPVNGAGLFALRNRQEEKLQELGLVRIFYDIEMPLVQVLYEMEREGFRVDAEELRRLGQNYTARLQTLTKEIYDLCGCEFNIGSPKQLGVVLFEKLGLPVIKKNKSGYSTDIEVLEKLEDKHPVIGRLMEYRQVSKLNSTYIEGLLSAADPQSEKVYTTFNQTATATGRISSNEPNLQNIPIRQRDEIRKVFIPSQGEYKLVCADYSQIELRVLAAIAKDANMLDAFIRGEDIHTRTAAEVFGVSAEEVTKEMRSSAKAVNFGIVYGISDFGLAKQLGIPRYQAAGYIERYLMEFSGVAAYMKDIVEQAKKENCVRTLWGRVRYIDELASKNYNIRAFGERAAMNTPIQGTAADIIKFAMIEVFRELKKRNLRSRLILQVHDELIIDTHPEEETEVRALLKDCMENACSELEVPLQVSIGSGKSWAEAK